MVDFLFWLVSLFVCLFVCLFLFCSVLFCSVFFCFFLFLYNNIEHLSANITWKTAIRISGNHGAKHWEDGAWFVEQQSSGLRWRSQPCVPWEMKGLVEFSCGKIVTTLLKTFLARAQFHFVLSQAYGYWAKEPILRKALTLLSRLMFHESVYSIEFRLVSSTVLSARRKVINH